MPQVGRTRALVLGALAGWAIAVPWLARGVGLGLEVPGRLEVVDHVVPGVVVLACVAVLARTPTGGLRRLGASSAAVLAGLWITATHAVLVPEALDGVSPWGPALLHLSAGPPVVAAALWILLREP